VTEAKRAQHAGACCLVIECVPAELAQRVTDAVEIPTIGIGAGPHCDGQVLVLQDMLGASPDFSPRFLRRYADLHSIIRDAANAYCSDVQETRYPLKEESYA
jgi:3-methyl-2-oxobutanoate hydroxymethyltransferase